MLCVPHALLAAPIPDEYCIGGFAIGPQAYSFRFFTLFEAIDKTAQTAGKVIELGTGLKVSTERPVVFNHDAPAEIIDLVQAHLTQHGIKAVNYGAVKMPSDSRGTKVFDRS